ncbi:MAG: polyprenyl synthetase family protein [Patescibacteria group bacterium]
MKHSPFSDYLETSTAQLQKAMYTALASWYHRSKALAPQNASVLTQFSQSVFGGKCIRGTLVQLGYEAASEKSSAAILQPAAAFEILHAGLLIHDDIIDKSPLRRGRLSVYTQLGGTHYGISQALCLGDAGFFLAYSLLSGSNFPSSRKNKALQTFSEIVSDTILGEMLDVELATKKDFSLPEEEILHIHRLKTARYTFVGPLLVGAILGGASASLLRKLSVFGEALGIAFQLQDDILGIFGDERKIGKSVTSDIAEGKVTLLAQYAFVHASSSQKAFLMKHYGKATVSTISCQKIKKAFVDTGSYKYSVDKINKYHALAKEIVSSFPIQSRFKAIFIDLCKVIASRNK